MMTVFTKFYDSPEFNKGEILRYAGVKKADAETEKLLESCLDECQNGFSYKVCFAEADIFRDGGTLHIGKVEAKGEAIKRNLEGCEKAVLFAATVGIGIDRLTVKYSGLSPSKALMFQAIGAERIEALCNVFNREMCEKYSAEKLFLRPRFSPGYGDFPLTAQKDMFAVLDCPRKIGLSLNESLVMTPSKSVTAIIGISAEKRNSAGKCENCTLKECSYKNEGKR